MADSASVGIWMAEMQRKLLIEPRRISMSSTKECCSIHRVPLFFFEQDENAYTPHIISIGPFHHSKRTCKLHAMEEHKWRYLRSIVRRCGDSCLAQFYNVVKQGEEAARECYSEKIQLDSNSFIEMMVLDGCFLIELFCRTMGHSLWVKERKNDPIFHLDWLHLKIKHDLFLLENQMPFFILQSLFELMQIQGFSLEEIALNYLPSYPKRNGNLDLAKLKVKHLLHLLHTSFIPSHLLHPVCSEQQSKVENIFSVSELEAAGIKFKSVDADTFLNIRYQNGVVEIPSLIMLKNTIPLFLNLIVFEQCYHHCRPFFTTYTFFMSNLINSHKDLDILSRQGIIKNLLGTNEEVTTFFKKVQSDVILFEGDFYLGSVSKNIARHCRKPWHELRVSLYLSNPWAYISMVSAIVLLFLTVAQTFFTAFPNFQYGN